MRQTFFWSHLIAGITGALFIFVMSVSGVLLTYERQMIAWADRDFASLPAPGVARVTPEALLTELAKAEQSPPATLTIRSDPTAAAEAGFADRVVYLDMYSGRVLGEGSARARRFFDVVREWHRYLWTAGENRSVGRAITGACNLVLLYLAISGMYLWLSRSWASVQAGAFSPARSASTAMTAYKWHAAIGFWCAVPLVFVAGAAAVIAYPWATDLMYSLTDTAPPEPPTAPRQLSGELSPARVNDAWRSAEYEMPGWQSISMRLPEANCPVYTFTVAESHRGRPDKRITLAVHQQTAEVIHRERFEKFSLGHRIRMYLPFVHTGEILGVAGQTIAGIAATASAVLALTGVILSWRRLVSWRLRRSGARDIAGYAAE